MRLFVDCDDTLVLWRTTPSRSGGVYYGDEYERNDLLIEAIDTMLMRPDVQLVVWSGGGASYAALWAERFLSGRDWLALSKDITLPTKDDICVDDVPLKVSARLFTPKEFVEHME